MGNIQLDSEEAAFISEAGINAEHLDIVTAVPVLQRRIRNICWTGSAVICILLILSATSIWKHKQLAAAAAARRVGNSGHDTELLAVIAERSNINQQDPQGRTALHEAVRLRWDEDGFDFLIGQGADLNKRAYGFEMNGGGKRDASILGLTPVMAAMFAGKKDPRRDEIALYLITHHGDKIDFTLETRHGQTLLAMAVRRLQDQPTNEVLMAIVALCKLKSNTKG